MVDMNRVTSNDLTGKEAILIMQKGGHVTDAKRVYGIVKIPNPDGWQVEYVAQYLAHDDIAENITPLTEWHDDYKDNVFREYDTSMDSEEAVTMMRNGCMVKSLSGKDEIYFIATIKIPCIGEKEYVFILDFDDLPCAYETPEDFISSECDVDYKIYTR